MNSQNSISSTQQIPLRKQADWSNYDWGVESTVKKNRKDIQNGNHERERGQWNVYQLNAWNITALYHVYITFSTTKNKTDVNTKRRDIMLLHLRSAVTADFIKDLVDLVKKEDKKDIPFIVELLGQALQPEIQEKLISGLGEIMPLQKKTNEIIKPSVAKNSAQINKKLYEQIIELAKSKDVVGLTKLINTGISIDFRYGLWSPVGFLASQGNIEAVDFLLEFFNASINHAAWGYAQVGLNKKVDELIACGASLNMALVGYAQKDDDEKVNHLISIKADPFFAVQGYAFANNIEKALYFIKKTGDKGLNMAAKSFAIMGKVQMVDNLISQGADINSAIQGYAIAGNVAAVEDLLLRGADINDAVWGYATGGWVDEVEDLLTRGADINDAMKGYTSANPNQVDILLARGGDVDKAIGAYAFSFNMPQIEKLVFSNQIALAHIVEYLVNAKYFANEALVLKILSSTNDSQFRRLLARAAEVNNKQLNGDALLRSATEIREIMQANGLTYKKAKELNDVVLSEVRQNQYGYKHNASAAAAAVMQPQVEDDVDLEMQLAMALSQSEYEISKRPHEEQEKQKQVAGNAANVVQTATVLATKPEIENKMIHIESQQPKKPFDRKEYEQAQKAGMLRHHLRGGLAPHDLFNHYKEYSTNPGVCYHAYIAFSLTRRECKEYKDIVIIQFRELFRNAYDDLIEIIKKDIHIQSGDGEKIGGVVRVVIEALKTDPLFVPEEEQKLKDKFNDLLPAEQKAFVQPQVAPKLDYGAASAATMQSIVEQQFERERELAIEQRVRSEQIKLHKEPKHEEAVSVSVVNSAAASADPSPVKNGQLKTQSFFSSKDEIRKQEEQPKIVKDKKELMLELFEDYKAKILQVLESSISFNTMTEPVIIHGDKAGNSYEKSEIEDWFEKQTSQGIPLTVPLTGQALPNGPVSLTPNRTLQKVIETFDEMMKAFNGLQVENVDSELSDNVQLKKNS